MKQLSIIIVNYNVKHFLEHCLLSVLRAAKGIDIEIFVVDNQSTDGSVEMVAAKFPEVQLIQNKENVGFARANNQAVAQSSGKYILYLNPDTIVAEDCFSSCLAYLDRHPDVGALGPRLIDGKGLFLPESKRGFPSAWVAFCKIIGLSSLFPKSNLFNNYHLGFLPEHETNEVDVLVGCFMLCRKAVIDEVGSFDETYFMYGEDIDLSYQIHEAGYKNVYFPNTTVIHYKGESTKKGSLNYVKMFYKAMIIFARKNFGGNEKQLYVFLITLAIYFKGFMAFLRNIFSALTLPMMDTVILIGSQLSMLAVWRQYVKPDTVYSTQLLIIFFTSYIIIWLTTLFFSGGYDKPYKAQRVLRGMLIGSIIILAIYALLPEAFRFSRGITVLGALLGTLAILVMRFILQKLGVKSVENEEHLNKRVLLIGTQQGTQEVRQLLAQAGLKKNIIGNISPTTTKTADDLGTIASLKVLAKLYQIGEIIFVPNGLTYADIIDQISKLGPQYDYKIHGLHTDSIIGSNSKHTAGDLYTTDISFEIATPSSKRNKRLVDMMAAFLFLLLSPVLIWFVKNKGAYIKNSAAVLLGRKTFIGYTCENLPLLKKHCWPVYPMQKEIVVPKEIEAHLNLLYAKEYNPWVDIQLIVKHWRW